MTAEPFWILVLCLAAVTLAAIAILAMLLLLRWVFGLSFRMILGRLMVEQYEDSLLEVMVSMARAKFIPVVENSLRAENRKAIGRPLGGPSAFPDFSGLAFNFAQLSTLPTPHDVPIDTAVVLGKRSRKPLKLDIPIIVSGMAYGVGLSEAAKLALAKGAAQVGTATNTGEGPFLKSEREAARFLIYQYGRSAWTHNLDAAKECDMVEIQVGQGARGGIGHSRKHDLLSSRVKALLGLAEGEDAVAHARLPGITSSRQLARLVKELRDATDGLPIAIKIAAGWTLEEDLKVAIDSGVDVVTVDGGQGATRDSIPALLDDFGLPTVAAVRRTHDFLVNQKVRDRVSVIISGGLRTPGDFLKALALGADAVAIGTMALFAVSHTQILKALPFEPPTQLVYDAGSLSHKFDVEKGALYLANFLSSCVDEMRECVRALGKTALSEVGREDMYALDERTAKITGVPFIGDFVYR